ncbi:DUF1080 domain-containing protein [Ulvibacterium sp.]|uniref:3-keto-disaccharide hydrolase n=1 Tax=Ulvibacterium sp. TaxID=2665914 RepID=UPI0026046CDF|nr:DUF1080 domain-containing protein [Ulvibacterium sp.]
MRSISYTFIKLTWLFFIVVFASCGEKKTDPVNKSEVSDATATTKSGWVSIFNGRNLDGWTMKIKGYPLGENFGNTFRVADSILSIRYDGYGPELNGRFGTLYYQKKLTDYRLKVEYRFVGETAPGAPDWGYRDSGIQFHGQPPNTQKLDQPFPICLEYNFHGGNGKDDRPLGALCVNGIFVEFDGVQNTTTCTPATVPRTFHGDQWVIAEIDIKDGRIVHFVNGEEILRYANPTFDPNNETAKTLMVDGDTSVKGGYVSFQSNSHPIDFRKIELMEY